jgi:hypothetical protein
MKLIAPIVLTIILTGCTSAQPTLFSPSRDYAVSIQSELFDAVRIDKNDITLFSDGKAIGYLRVEPIPADVASSPDILKTLRSASESDTVKTQALNVSSGFTGFSAKVREYLTGYLIHDDHPDTILIISFPEGQFDEISRTVSSGI